MGEVVEPIGSHRYIALDTSIFIYHFERNRVYSDIAGDILSAVSAGRVSALASIIGVMEVLTGPYQRQDLETADWYVSILLSFPNLRIHSIGMDTARNAARIRARYGVPLPDSVHLATALRWRAETFITNDRRLQKFEELPVTVLSDFVH